MLYSRSLLVFHFIYVSIFIFQLEDNWFTMLYCWFLLYNNRLLNRWISHNYTCVCVYVYRVSLVAQMVKNLPAVQETQVWSFSWKDPLEKGMQPTLVFLPREFHGQRTPVDYSPWDCKQLDTTERLTQHNIHTHTHTPPPFLASLSSPPSTQPF